MKWGRKKCLSSPSSTHTSSSSSIIDRVFPVSWLSKLKQRGGNNIAETTARSDQMKCRDRHSKLLNFPTPNGSLKQGRFYSTGFDDDNNDDEAYWRISFGEERIIEGRRSTGGINPLWYDDEFRIPVSGFKSFDESDFKANKIVPDRGECRNFNDMVLDVKKMKEKKNRETMINGKSRSDLNLRKSNVREKQENLVRRFERVVLSPVHDSRKQDTVPYSNFVLSPVRENISLEAIEENGIFADNSEKLSISECQRLEEDSIYFKEMKIKTETKKKKPSQGNGREYYYTRKPKHNNKIKAYSPRTECKIRALEEMKKARINSKKKERKGGVMEKNVFDSFAVVKSSFNPQKDFRESMVEMIKEKHIKRPEELEELLACYLTLNSDEYHDVIIEVFRLVWLEMKEVYLDSQICNCRYCDY